MKMERPLERRYNLRQSGPKNYKLTVYLPLERREYQLPTPCINAVVYVLIDAFCMHACILQFIHIKHYRNKLTALSLGDKIRQESYTRLYGCSIGLFHFIRIHPLWMTSFVCPQGYSVKARIQKNTGIYNEIQSVLLKYPEIFVCPYPFLLIFLCLGGIFVSGHP